VQNVIDKSLRNLGRCGPWLGVKKAEADLKTGFEKERNKDGKDLQKREGPYQGSIPASK
jgi:hypothetical protein